MSDTYELRVRGHLDDRLANWLGDLTIVRNGDGTSTITAAATDQARLHGLLAGLRDLGAPVLSLRVLEVPAPTLPGVVVTDRLRLRPGTAEDAGATWEYRRLPEVGEWLTEIPRDLDAYRATFSDPDRLANTVVVELEGQVIGDFMLRLEDGWAQAEVAECGRRTQAELGWVLDPAFTGWGFATEAVDALLRVCFEELGVRRVVATCFLGNESSWRLMERVGMRRETHSVAESLHRNGQWLDTLGYALLAAEWRSRFVSDVPLTVVSRDRSGSRIE
ncbi:MAG TPA: GNAT family protein [Nocardioidaceae bacterium]|nr:GNAT family protein [Nocardioidaceae bacterium]